MWLKREKKHISELNKDLLEKLLRSLRQSSGYYRDDGRELYHDHSICTVVTHMRQAELVPLRARAV